MIDSRFEYFAVVNIVYLTTLCLLLQDDVNAYRSSPPLLGIFRPSYLVPSAHAELLPGSEDSSEIEGFSSDNETADAEAGETAGDDGESTVPSRAKIPNQDIPRVLDRLRGSVATPHKLPMIGE